MNYKEAIAVIRCNVPRRDGETQQSRGTGVFVGDGLVLTALHVVANRQLLKEQATPSAPTETAKNLPPDPPDAPSLPSNSPDIAPGLSLHFANEIRVQVGAAPAEPATVVGRLFHPHEDWVFLDCPALKGTPTLPVAEIPVQAKGELSDCFGYPETRREGMAFVFRLDDLTSEYDGALSFQLYSDQAAAGDGAPVEGLSGAPLVWKNAVIGIVRSALKRNIGTQANPIHATVAGTLFACPTQAFLKRAKNTLGGRLSTLDPYAGLPPLPERELPNLTPFLGLSYFTGEKHAEVFWGRGAEIRDLYFRLTDPKDRTIIMVYGQSGVGKSSFLDAGLLPRFATTHHTVYIRRNKALGLRELWEKQFPLGANSFAANQGKPALVVVDQLEEVFTDPMANVPTVGHAPPGPSETAASALSSDAAATELTTFLQTIQPYFADGKSLHGSRIIFSFRKEWLPEIRAAVADVGLPLSEYFVKPLGRNNIVEAVNGITSTKRLRNKYQVTIEPDLPDEMATRLLLDSASPIAPSLQLLLTKLHTAIQDKVPDERKLTVSAFRQEYTEGGYLSEMFKKALAGLPDDLKKHETSGLVLDLLEAHTTDRGSTRTLTRADILANYIDPPVDDLLKELDKSYLVATSRTAGSEEMPTSRLAHDTLGPLVRERFAKSTAPGQRARRLLESRVGDWTENMEGKSPRSQAFGLFLSASDSPRKETPSLLNAADVRIISEGLSGMRTPTAKEANLLATSRMVLSMKNSVAGLGLVGMFGLLAAFFWFAYQSETSATNSERLEVEAALRESALEARRCFDVANRKNDPREALLWMSRAVEKADESDPLLPVYLTRATHLFTETAPLSRQIHTDLVAYAELNPAWSHLLILGASGNVRVLALDVSDPIAGVKANGEPKDLAPDGTLHCFNPALSPDGKLAATAKKNQDGKCTLRLYSTENGVSLWEGEVSNYSKYPTSHQLEFGANGDWVGWKLRHQWEILAQRGSDKKWSAADVTIHDYLDSGRSPATSHIFLSKESVGLSRSLLKVTAFGGKPPFQPVDLKGSIESAVLSENGAFIGVTFADPKRPCLYNLRVLAAATGQLVFERLLSRSESALQPGNAACFPPSSEGETAGTPITISGLTNDGTTAIVGSSPVIITKDSPPLPTKLQCGDSEPELVRSEAILCRNKEWAYRFALSPDHKVSRVRTGPTDTHVWFSEDGNRIVSLSREGVLSINFFGRNVAPATQVDFPEKIVAARWGNTPDTLFARTTNDEVRKLNLISRTTAWKSKSSNTKAPSPTTWNIGQRGVLGVMDVSRDGAKLAYAALVESKKWSRVVVADTATYEEKTLDLEQSVVALSCVNNCNSVHIVSANWYQGIPPTNNLTVLTWTPTSPGASKPQPTPMFPVDNCQLRGILRETESPTLLCNTGKTQLVGPTSSPRPLASLESIGGETQALVESLLLGGQVRAISSVGGTGYQIQIANVFGGPKEPAALTIGTFLGQVAIGATNASAYTLPPETNTFTDPFVISHSAQWIGSTEPWRPEAPFSTLRVFSTKTGTTLATFEQPDRLAAATFSPAGDKLITIATNGAVRETFMGQTYTTKPAWVKDLGLFATSQQIGKFDAREDLAEWSNPDRRKAFLAQLKKAAAAGDAAAQHCLNHISPP